MEISSNCFFFLGIFFIYVLLPAILKSSTRCISFSFFFFLLQIFFFNKYFILATCLQLSFENHENRDLHLFYIINIWNICKTAWFIGFFPFLLLFSKIFNFRRLNFFILIEVSTPLNQICLCNNIEKRNQLNSYYYYYFLYVFFKVSYRECFIFQ